MMIARISLKSSSVEVKETAKFKSNLNYKIERINRFSLLTCSHGTKHTLNVYLSRDCVLRKTKIRPTDTAMVINCTMPRQFMTT